VQCCARRLKRVRQLLKLADKMFLGLGNRRLCAHWLHDVHAALCIAAKRKVAGLDDFYATL